MFLEKQNENDLVFEKESLKSSIKSIQIEDPKHFTSDVLVLGRLFFNERS